jgi:hypothetical protein
MHINHWHAIRFDFIREFRVSENDIGDILFFPREACSVVAREFDEGMRSVQEFDIVRIGKLIPFLNSDWSPFNDTSRSIQRGQDGHFGERRDS